MALFEKDQVSLDLTEIEQEAFAEATEKAIQYFFNLPEDILNEHNVNRNESWVSLLRFRRQAIS